MKKALIFVFVFIVSACTTKTKEVVSKEELSHPKMIDICNIEYSDTPQKLSMFVDSIEYVRIEDEPLIPDLWNVHLAEDHFGNIYLDFDQIFKYKPNGQFIKSLFKKGQGPGEVTRKYGRAVYDMNHKKVYVANSGLGYNIYTLDGEFIKCEDNALGHLNRKYLNFWNDYAVTYFYNNGFPQKGESVNMDSTFFIQVTDKNQLVYQLPNYHYDIKAVFSGRGLAESSSGPVQNGTINDSLYWMKPHYVDTVYTTTDWKDVSPYYVIHKSDRAADYAWSVRAKVGDITKNEAFKEMLGSVCVFDSGVLFNYMFDRERIGCGFCPADGKCTVISQSFINDIDGFCPTLDMNKILMYNSFYQKGNYLYVLVDAFKFFEDGAKSPFGDLKEDSNPVLVKLRLKLL